MELQIPESLFESLQIIIKYQNTLLLKEISKEKGWKLSELKKEFLKEEDIQNLLKKHSKKKNKVKKKVTPKKKSQTVSEEAQEATVEETQDSVDGAKENIQMEIEDKTVKKKKLKKVVNEKEIKCHKYTFEGAVFYVNVENENAYDKNMEFVGRKLGNGINFDADELEN